MKKLYVQENLKKIVFQTFFTICFFKGQVILGLFKLLLQELLLSDIGNYFISMSTKFFLIITGSITKQVVSEEVIVYYC